MNRLRSERTDWRFATKRDSRALRLVCDTGAVRAGAGKCAGFYPIPVEGGSCHNDTMLSVDPLVIKAGCEWALEQQKFCLIQGRRLTPGQIRDAKLVGVSHPDTIRVLEVSSIPLPDHPLLRELLKRLNLLEGSSRGFAFHHGVMIRHELISDRRCLIHELARVSQYERRNGIEGFLTQYIWEWLNLGPRSPMSQATVLIEERLCGARTKQSQRILTPMSGAAIAVG